MKIIMDSENAGKIRLVIENDAGIGVEIDVRSIEVSGQRDYDALMRGQPISQTVDVTLCFEVDEVLWK